MMETLQLGSKREFFWDHYLIGETDGRIVQHSPVYRGDVFTCDRPWEGSGCCYFVILRDAGRFRMYYRGSRLTNEDGSEKVENLPGVWCYAESRDGIHWERPSLGLREFEGSRENNIILNDKWYDNFYVFLDDNPDCPPEERYKGLYGCSSPFGLHVYVSGDGISFREQGLITDNGAFDSMNVAFWDREAGEYRCYLRDLHGYTDPKNKWGSGGIRDIRVSCSKDFIHWSRPEQILFDPSKEDYPLYTNQVQPYYRGEHVRIGFPSRYIERPWSSSYEYLPSPEHRRARMNFDPRYGLAMSDCVIMTSRDGKQFDRMDEAFWTPGPESAYNWVYGDCFPAYGMVETEPPIPGGEKEISLFKARNSWLRPVTLERWAIRRDGFFSLSSTYHPCFLRTKPFIFRGARLTINFSTSVAGGMVLTLVTEDGKRFDSCELFGDSTCRPVDFPELPDLTPLAGSRVTLEARMSDSHLYSLKFD